MSRSESLFEPWIVRLQQHCRAERYSVATIAQYRAAGRRYLRHLEHHGRSLETVSPAELNRYLDKLRPAGTDRPARQAQRWTHGAAIRMLLMLAQGSWPPATLPTSRWEQQADGIVRSYDHWLELRGLATATRQRAREEAWRLLRWCEAQGQSLASLSLAEVDRYIAWRGARMRRRSVATLASNVRGLLRHCYRAGRLDIDLAADVDGPRIYALESIPSMIQPEDVRKVLRSAQADRSPRGRRDYAILMLLSSYGLRSGEITGLRLNDIDWRRERLHVRHSKTGAHSELPLLREVANALLDYLKQARPATTHREVFLRMRAPYRPLPTVGALRKLIQRRLETVGVVLTGKQGAHVFRHGRAVGLLRAGTPLKVIGDVLGHRSIRSTSVYLKLATEDLRAVALDLPTGVSP